MRRYVYGRKGRARDICDLYNRKWEARSFADRGLFFGVLYKRKRADMHRYTYVRTCRQLVYNGYEVAAKLLKIRRALYARFVWLAVGKIIFLRRGRLTARDII